MMQDSGLSNKIMNEVKSGERRHFSDARHSCPSTTSEVHLSTANPNKNKHNWGVYDAMHSYDVSEENNGSSPDHCCLKSNISDECGTLHKKAVQDLNSGLYLQTNTSGERRHFRDANYSDLPFTEEEVNLSSESSNKNAQNWGVSNAMRSYDVSEENKGSSPGHCCVKSNISGECGNLHKKAVQDLNSGLFQQTNTSGERRHFPDANYSEPSFTEEEVRLSRKNPNKNNQSWGVCNAMHSYDVSEENDGSSPDHCCLKSNISDECGTLHKQAVQDLNSGLYQQTNTSGERRHFRDAGHSCPSTTGEVNISSESHSKNEQNWGVCDAMGSYAVPEKLNDLCLNDCPSTPVNTGSRYSQRAKDDLHSSWNVLGVKSPDYSSIQKQA